MLTHSDSDGTRKNSDRVQTSKRLDSDGSVMLNGSCKQHFSEFLGKTCDMNGGIFFA